MSVCEIQGYWAACAAKKSGIIVSAGGKIFEAPTFEGQKWGYPVNIFSKFLVKSFLNADIYEKSNTFLIHLNTLLKASGNFLSGRFLARPPPTTFKKGYEVLLFLYNTHINKTWTLVSNVSYERSQTDLYYWAAQEVMLSLSLFVLPFVPFFLLVSLKFLLVLKSFNGVSRQFKECLKFNGS